MYVFTKVFVDEVFVMFVYPVYECNMPRFNKHTPYNINAHIHTMCIYMCAFMNKCASGRFHTQHINKHAQYSVHDHVHGITATANPARNHKDSHPRRIAAALAILAGLLKPKIPQRLIRGSGARPAMSARQAAVPAARGCLHSRWLMRAHC